MVHGFLLRFLKTNASVKTESTVRIFKKEIIEYTSSCQVTQTRFLRPQSFLKSSRTLKTQPGKFQRLQGICRDSASHNQIRSVVTTQTESNTCISILYCWKKSVQLIDEDRRESELSISETWSLYEKW